MRQIWQDIYALEVFPPSQSFDTIIAQVNPVLDGVSTCGFRGVSTGTSFNNVRYNLLPNSHFPIKINASPIARKLVTGQAQQDSAAFNASPGRPDIIPVQISLNARNFSVFTNLLFQNGYQGHTIPADGDAPEGSPYFELFNLYTSSEPVIYANLVKFNQKMGELNEVDQCLQACIVKKLTIKGEEGAIIEGTVDFIGAKVLQGSMAGSQGQKLDLSTAFDDLHPFRFEDLTIKLGVLGQEYYERLSTIFVPKFDLTFENNAMNRFYGDEAAKSISLGEFVVSGSISIPWDTNTSDTEGRNQQILDFLDGISKILDLTLIGSDTATKVQIKLQIQLEDYSNTDINGLPMIEIKFKGFTNSKMSASLDWADAPVSVRIWNNIAKYRLRY